MLEANMERKATGFVSGLFLYPDFDVWNAIAATFAVGSKPPKRRNPKL